LALEKSSPDVEDLDLPEDIVAEVDVEAAGGLEVAREPDEAEEAEDDPVDVAELPVG
jgi:hypothetical protein